MAKFELRLPTKMCDYLKQLNETGLYGLNVEATIQRLLEAAIRDAIGCGTIENQDRKEEDFLP